MLIKSVSLSTLLVLQYSNAQRRDRTNDSSSNEEQDFFESNAQMLRSSRKFDGFTKFTYDGVEMIASGVASIDELEALTPAETTGCSVYQPDKSWGHQNFKEICEVINDQTNLKTDCETFDDDHHGGLCGNYDFVLTYENFGRGYSTGTDIWAHSSTFVSESATGCHSRRQSNGCQFPTDEFSHTGVESTQDCSPMAQWYTIVVYACAEYSSDLKTFPPPIDSIEINAFFNILIEYFEFNGEDADRAIEMTAHGCYCPYLTYEYGTSPDSYLKPTDTALQLDTACRYHFRCQTCAFDQTCQASENPYPYNIRQDANGEIHCDGNGNNDCQEQICLCDLATAARFKDKISEDLQIEPVCQLPTGGKARKAVRTECCGQSPVFKYYNSDHDDCDDSVYQQPVVEECVATKSPCP